MYSTIAIDVTLGSYVLDILQPQQLLTLVTVKNFLAERMFKKGNTTRLFCISSNTTDPQAALLFNCHVNVANELFYKSGKYILDRLAVRKEVNTFSVRSSLRVHEGVRVCGMLLHLK